MVVVVFLFVCLFVVVVLGGRVGEEVVFFICIFY